MENTSSDELDVEVAHTQGSAANFSGQGEHFGECSVHIFTVSGSLAQGVGTFTYLGLGESLDLGLEIVDLKDDGRDKVYIALAGVEKLS